jgi:flagellar motility protein MotE (MotC chaperone)
MSRFRIFPIVIVLAVLLLTLKIGDVWQSAGRVLGTSPAIGAEHETAAAKEVEKQETVEDTLEEAPGDSLIERLATPDVVDVSPTEIRMLEDLLERRTQLEAWERDIDMREKLLAATESRIDEKIDTLKSMNDSIEGLVKQYNDREDEKITSLVKIYETMKPKDAARIFNELDVEILTEVLRRMREAKAAPIIAKMDPAKAKVITLELAVRNSLPDVAAATVATDDN